jgi:hypothetical protein
LVNSFDTLIVFQSVSAQGTQGTYTDPATGITFATWTVPPASVNSAPQGLTLGWALPPDAETVSSPDYIGLIVSMSKTKNKFSPDLVNKDCPNLQWSRMDWDLSFGIDDKLTTVDDLGISE